MIPLSIELKNFLSYGSHVQTIDFSAYPLICLSGKNGHGKSALLDAITWALWGQARKISGVAKADQGLLRLGQTQMMVTFNFICNNQTYRIRREYAQTYGKPYVALDFGMLDETHHEERFIPLNASTIRATQENIEQTLHLDFESFINSAFLRQGQANEFSKKSPKERKEILASILGLDQYENIRKKALEKVKIALTEKAHIHALQEKITLELESLSFTNVRITEVTEKLKKIAVEEKLLHKKSEHVRQERIKLTEEYNNVQIITFKINHLEQQEHEKFQTMRNLLREWRATNKKKCKLIYKTSLEETKAQLTATINQYQYLLQKSFELKEQLLKKKETIYRIEQRIQSEHATLRHQQELEIERLVLEKQHREKKVHDLQNQYEQYEKELRENTVAIHAIQKDITTMSQEIESYKNIEKQFEKRKNFYQSIVTKGNFIDTELSNLERKRQLSENDRNPSCPLCEQNLSASRKRFLKAKFVRNEQHLKHTFMRISKLISKLKILLVKQHEELDSIKKIIEQQAILHSNIHEYTKKNESLINNMHTITQQIEHDKNKIDMLSATIKNKNDELSRLSNEQCILRNNNEYTSLQQTITEIEQSIVNLGYQADTHQKAIQQLHEIEVQLTELSELHKQIALQNQRKKEINELCTKLKKLKNEKEALKKSNIFSDLKKQEDTLNQQEEVIVHTLHEYNQKKEELLQEKGSLENQKKKYEQLENEYKQQQKKIKALDETITDYQMIAQTTSKDGIQALLIENAIPEIEQEANDLLAKLTDNQAQIFIDSLRDLKKGGTKETLDIKISDGLGIRQYELFSGGEAFRIDFALRIAISKLLARRAGTSLQTLIIDEGFGSQDEEGLAYIMDTLYKIQHDFSKIIIVSHLTSMKDQFPVHFLITKEYNGSTVKVIEQ